MRRTAPTPWLLLVTLAPLVAACGGINVVSPPLGDSSGDGGSSVLRMNAGLWSNGESTHHWSPTCTRSSRPTWCWA